MKKIIAILLCMVFLISLAACTSKETPGDSTNQPEQSSQPSQSAKPGESDQSSQPEQQTSTRDTITVAYPNDPGNLSPFGTGNSFTDFIIYNIYESLFKLSDTTGEVVPLLMESYDLSDDGKTYTFHLKKGIKDTNGNEITAYDCVFSYKLCADSPMGVNTQVVDFDNTEAIDEYTFKLATTASGKIYMSQFGKVYIVSEKSYNDSPDQLITTPVGTGPYMLDQWVQGASVKFVTNEDYWGQKPSAKNLEFKIISEQSQRTTTLMTGEVDFVYDYLITDADYINDTPGFKTEDRDTNTVYAMYFNCSEFSIGSDINFRKAVSLALNNEALTNMIYKGRNTAATTSQSKSCFDYTAEWEGCEFYNYNVDAAKEYLAKSSYDGSTLVLVTKSNTYSFDLLCEAVQGQLKQIGVNVEIQQYEPATLNTLVLNQPEDWDLDITDHSTFSNYAVDSVQLIHIRRNYPHIDDELKNQFNEICSVAISSADVNESLEYSAKAINLNQDNCTTRAICYATMKFAYADFITNINCYSTNKIDWREITFK